MGEIQSVSDFPFSISRKLLTSDSPTGHKQMKWSAPSPNNKATLDSDLVVVLAVLLCALIVVLILNALLRCFLRCRRQTMVESLDGEANTGLKKAAMKGLPIIVYTATSKPRSVPMDCPICLAEFEEGEKVRIIPKCNHGFHLECIDKWLISHSSCPMCRHSLNLQSQKKKPGCAAIVQTTESTDSIQTVGLVSPHAETLQRTPHEVA